MTEFYYRYDYAWKTPGWTVQNPSFVQFADGYADPGLPSDITKVRVYGDFLDGDSGRSLEGVFEIRCDDILVYQTTKSEVIPGVKKIRFNRGGFSIYLPATDDPQLTPAFVYQGKLTVGGRTQEFEFSLPSATLEVNVLDLINP